MATSRLPREDHHEVMCRSHPVRVQDRRQPRVTGCYNQHCGCDSLQFLNSPIQASTPWLPKHGHRVSYDHDPAFQTKKPEITLGRQGRFRWSFLSFYTKFCVPWCEV